MPKFLAKRIFVSFFVNVDLRMFFNDLCLDIGYQRHFLLFSWFPAGQGQRVITEKRSASGECRNVRLFADWSSNFSIPLVADMLAHSSFLCSHAPGAFLGRHHGGGARGVGRQLPGREGDGGRPPASGARLLRRLVRALPTVRAHLRADVQHVPGRRVRQDQRGRVPE